MNKEYGFLNFDFRVLNFLPAVNEKLLQFLFQEFSYNTG